MGTSIPRCPRCRRKVKRHAEATVNGQQTLICPTADGVEDRRQYA